MDLSFCASELLWLNLMKLLTNLRAYLLIPIYYYLFTDTKLFLWYKLKCYQPYKSFSTLWNQLSLSLFLNLQKKLLSFGNFQKKIRQIHLNNRKLVSIYIWVAKKAYWSFDSLWRYEVLGCKFLFKFPKIERELSEKISRKRKRYREKTVTLFTIMVW